MHSIKYQYASLAHIIFSSNEQVNRRYDQNNIPTSFYPTDITLNKMPKI